MTNPEHHQTLFMRIRDYGEDTYREAKRFVGYSEKLAVAREQLTFNKRCKRTNILPKSLQIKPVIKTRKGYQIAYNTGKQYLDAFIDDNYYCINQAHQHIRNEEEILQQNLPIDFFNLIKTVAGEKMSHYKSVTSR